MSAALQTRAEIEKLARALGVPVERLESLSGVPAAQIRATRHAVADALFEADRSAFARAAAAAKVIPSALAAKLAQHALGPLLAARAATLLDPGQARDLARRLPVAFLADLAVEIDPRHARELLTGMPGDQIAQTAAELERRGEHVAMGAFVGCLSDEALAAAVAVLSDASLLHVGFLIEEPERLDGIVASLPDVRLTGIIGVAAREDRWSELLGMAGYLTEAQLRRMLALGDAAGHRPALMAAAGRDPALRAAAAPLLDLAA